LLAEPEIVSGRLGSPESVTVEELKMTCHAETLRRMGRLIEFFGSAFAA
jgi:hypothetical protein